MRERAPPQPATPKTPATLPVQRKCKSCQEDEKRIQPALRMGSAGDPAEQEADRIGEQVAQRWHLSPLAAHPPLPVLRLSPAASIPSLQLPSLQSPIEQPHAGQPLPAPTRTFMEKQFAFDFSKVRIHHDSEAHADADNLGARAFTYGSHIYLGAEAQLTDQRLLAHELTHVVQQGAAGPQIQADLWYGRPRRSQPGQSPLSPGTVAHEEILPIVGRANPNLFTEAPIPKGAPGSASGNGRADFYLASTTLGLVFDEGQQPNWYRRLRRSPALRLFVERSGRANRRGSGRPAHGDLLVQAGDLISGHEPNRRRPRYAPLAGNTTPRRAGGHPAGGRAALAGLRPGGGGRSASRRSRLWR